jgi:hypothetical protein
MEKYTLKETITFRHFWTDLTLKKKLILIGIVSYCILILPFAILMLEIVGYELPPDDQIVFVSIAFLLGVLIYPFIHKVFRGDGKRIWSLDVLIVYTVIVGFFARPIYHVFIIALLYMPIISLLFMRWVLLMKIRGQLDKFEEKWNLK